MIYSPFRVYTHVRECVIKYLLLSLKMRHYISIELSFQLKSYRFDVRYVVAHLRLPVFLATFLSWFRNEILEYQLRFLLSSPTDPTVIRA